jgi:predicted RNA-binding protein with PIN domain
MTIHIIIDGYNLIRRSPALSRLDRQDIACGREALVARLSAYRKLKPHRITVVFDGAQAPAFTAARDQVKGIQIVFSRHGELADAVIVRMARQEREKAIVVSSDDAVARAAEACGAATIDSSEFEARVAMATALEGADAPEEESAARRISTRKKGAGKRLPKRMRQQQSKTAKL